MGQLRAPALPRGLLPKSDRGIRRHRPRRWVPIRRRRTGSLGGLRGRNPDSIKLQMKEHSEEWQDSRVSGSAGRPAQQQEDTDQHGGRQAAWRSSTRYAPPLSARTERHTTTHAGRAQGRRAAGAKTAALEDTTIEGAQEVLTGSPDGVLLTRTSCRAGSAHGQVRWQPRRREGSRLLAAELQRRPLRAQPGRSRRVGSSRTSQ